MKRKVKKKSKSSEDSDTDEIFSKQNIVSAVAVWIDTFVTFVLRKICPLILYSSQSKKKKKKSDSDEDAATDDSPLPPPRKVVGRARKPISYALKSDDDEDSD